MSLERFEANLSPLFNGGIMKKLSILSAFVVLLSVTLCIPTPAQQKTNPNGTHDSNMHDSGSQAINNNAPAANPMRISSGERMKVKGVIVRRDDNNMVTMHDQSGSELTVKLTPSTKVEEKKSNPFRGSKKYTQAQLLRGLNVEIEGRGDSSGALVAEKVKFLDDDFRVALTVDSQVVPIEHRMGQTEDRVSRAEQNAERLSGQVEELGQVANLAKGGARAAQETADAAVEGINRTNDRISSLDDYEVRKTETLSFRLGSAVLSPEAKSTLDQIAEQAKTEKGFVIEVRGFASADGSENLNRRLSQRRADAVVQYLAEQHDIPLRRIVLPYGYGEAQPVADNSTRDGRVQNRRAEVKVMVNQGLGNPVNVPGRTVGTNRED